MSTLRELIDFLDNYLQPELFKDYCPNGLQIEGSEQVQKVGFAVSASLATLVKAVEAKVDALICHHGLFWKGDSFVISGSKREKMQLLLENKISLFGYHLPLDAHREVGNNWSCARDLGWKELAPFGEFDGSLIGVRGTFGTMPIEAFIAEVEAYYGHQATFALGGKKEVTSAALVSGGAWRSLQEAALAGVDCFITGNFDEPAWSIAHEEKINFMALGHSATERVGPKALAEKVAEGLGVKTLFLDVNNPF